MMNWQKATFLVITFDPVHIGTGGYRLGRVDNAIAREPGTNLPKIPGTSLNGAIRSAAAYRYKKPKCAGQSGHCSNSKKCPICYTFGSSSGKEAEVSDEQTTTFAGTISIFDAKIVLFPIWSMFGPVWVTTSELLTKHYFKVSEPLNLEEDGQVAVTSGVQATGNALNLGWLMLNVEKNNLTITPPEKWKNTELADAINRTVIVRESIFSHIINSNLEVRTSVSIDPATGAAETGALFTYEAIPRAAFLAFDVVLDDYRLLYPNPARPFPVDKTYVNSERDQDNAGRPLDKPWEGPLDVMRSGLGLVEYLGIGGMGTRGFGRIKQVGGCIVSNA